MRDGLLPLVVATVFLVGCRTGGAATASPKVHRASVNPPVEIHGALREMMHEGRTGPVVEVARATESPDSVAVGALAGLTGEVTVLDGEAWLSYAEADGMARTVRTKTPSDSATLLVMGRLPNAQWVTLEEDVPLTALADRISALAQARGVDVTRPFPFTVEGTLRELAWHVVDGSKLREGASHQEHMTAGVQSRKDSATGVLVGFYSTQHHGIFTHHDSDAHVHVVLAEENASGHVDGVTVGRGARVRLPAPSAPAGP
ncbi:acetolactate decarboxylase [Pyxidicoccus xibeiensis]|uniref:acetolactate decarboxylase n=1 Tax=Pyxidicoccus xibeiensis TaxID=2906759 RepID=UPI0020A712A6|nr:acetolactate decarboxylase [Pyxidicoccus xibeiensis]MCP3135753.1 acetolactate decarboxylase [Pyxidicoccus xibeiensis]